MSFGSRSDAMVLQILESINAIRKGHFQYSSGMHGDTYIDHRAFFRDDMRKADRIAFCLSEALLKYDNPDVVLGPDRGGADLAIFVARHLSCLSGKTVKRLYVPKYWDEQTKRDVFFLNRGDAQYLKDACVMIVDDVVTSGRSLKEMAQLIIEHGGVVEAAGTIWNRGGALLYNLGILHVAALLDIPLSAWDPKKGECQLCTAGKPLDLIFGHGVYFQHPSDI